MHIKITNLDTGKTYTADTRSECVGVDVHIWDMMHMREEILIELETRLGKNLDDELITGRVVTMGHTIGEFI
jgi:hypothetical protein